MRINMYSYIYIYICMCFLLVYSQLFHSIYNNINEINHKFTIKITIYFELDFLITLFYHAYQH